MCRVRSLVTDNTFSIKGMHTQFQNDSDFNLIPCICFVYLLNLLVEDLNILNLKEQILCIC